MAATPRPDHFHDQLLAHLREAPGPQTAREVANRNRVRRLTLWTTMPRGLAVRIGETIRGHVVIAREAHRPGGHAGYLVAKPAPTHTIYQDLDELARAGLVKRLKVFPGRRHVRWTYPRRAQSVARAEIAALDELYGGPGVDEPHRRQREEQ
ncbi:hypothetical protein [Mycolicibacterium mageritense]|uniref:hypothetical protein n=1 Tax=Mycolicibacterium mageritense TaxID=53462 RepID=UPI0011DB886E|nr:hypothetical protein [Mycolicibacterium mageritense]TXI53494.1 MAG: hypothetical protein E6Q55_34990 [Mycolicibacterium mageritense]